MKHPEMIAKLSLEQKCALLSGKNTWQTQEYPKQGVPAAWLSDGPNGLRKQAGAADHLGLNPSVPATCFPTAATMANSWDPALGEEVGRALGEETAANRVNVLLVPDFIYNIGTTVLNGGISMVIFFFVNKIIFPEGEAQKAN